MKYDLAVDKIVDFSKPAEFLPPPSINITDKVCTPIYLVFGERKPAVNRSSR